MRGMGAISFWLAFAAWAGANEVTLRQVSPVYSGPSATYYPTGQLNPGAVVRVKQIHFDFVEIEPPPGSYSLIPVSAVNKLTDRTGTVKAFSAETLVGAADKSSRLTKIGVRLDRGAQVEILGQEIVSTEAGPVEHYVIKPPAKESRFLPRNAVDPTAPPPASATPLGGGQRFGFGGPPIGAPSSGDLPYDVQAQLKQADEAYQKALLTGDWAEAEQRYQELAQSLHHSARMTALNRLEFIKQRKGKPPEPPLLGGRRSQQQRTQQMAYGPAGGWTPEGSVPRTRLPVEPPAQQASYQTGAAVPLARPPGASPLGKTGPQSAAPGGASPAKTTSLGAQPPGDRIPPQQLPNREAPAAKSVHGAGPAPMNGILRKSFQNHRGQPLYYLVDHQGGLKTYVTPPAGVRMEGFVDRAVQVQGMAPHNDPSLSGKPHMDASRIELLGK